jgi:dephospho-CoA kinase
MPSKTVPLVGVTGGIGSGKSAACLCFERLGRRVISADLIARELTETNEAVRRAIAREFGDAMYDSAGKLQRTALARIVFADPVKLRALNTIVHPLVFSSLGETVARLNPSAARPYVVVEAALIFESGMDNSLDATVVVNAPEEVRIARVLRRSYLSREEIGARMRSQLPADDIARRADFVIENGGTEQELNLRVEFIDRILTLMLGKTESRTVREIR